VSEDLANFLLDRVRSDQFRAENLQTVAELLRVDNPGFADLVDDTARQILALCETKRIVAEQIRGSAQAGKSPPTAELNAARAFVSAYRHHPDYRQEWAVGR
jgi:hypothetical protein